MIRKATAADIDRCAEIYEAHLTNEANGKNWSNWRLGLYPVRATAENALAHDWLWVGEDEKGIFGCVILNQNQAEEYKKMDWHWEAADDEVLVIHTLVIDPNRRGEGKASEFLKAAGKTVHLGGNIGKPLLPEIETIKKTDVCVVELSSFQLISMRQSPDVAVVTNLAPNHLDIHKDMDEYIEAKRNIILYQNENQKAVLNYDNEITRLFDLSCKGEVVFFSRQKKLRRGAYLDGDTIMYAEDGKLFDVLDIRDIKIPGMHNVENYMTAICAVWGEVSLDSIRKVAREFGGVEHRAEFVRELDGVKYYNDSIASSPTRTASGTLSLYDFKIILIAGGYDKHLDYTELGDKICDTVKIAILMGATADKIETAIKASAKYKENNPVIFRVKNMDEAVLCARENAVAGDIVSMSPASASFDLYKDFDARGKHFKALVNAL